MIEKSSLNQLFDESLMFATLAEKVDSLVFKNQRKIVMLNKTIRLSRHIFFLFTLLFSCAVLFAKQPAHRSYTDIDTWIAQAKENIHHTKLPNGLNIIHYNLPHTCEVFVGLSYTVGSKDEYAHEHGFAHMVEHMIFKGTTTMSETDLDSIIEKFCVSRFNASTSLDQTNYYFVSDNKNWHVFVNILADCMANVRFDAHHFASEVKAVINELKMRSANPFVKIYDLLFDELFPPNHPYTHAIGGNKEVLLHGTADDLKKFYRRHYGPENATLFIVGNLDKKQVVEHATRAFGTITSTPQPKHQQPKFNADFFKFDFKKKNITCFTHTPNPTVAYVWHVPGLKKHQGTITSCLSYVLQERLRSLKDEHDLVLSTKIYAFTEVLSGFFGIFIEPKTDADKKPTTDACTAHIESTIEDLMKHGPTDQELEIFKSSSRNSFLELFEDSSNIANLLQATYHINHNPYECFDDLARIATLTKKDVQLFCKQYLRSITMNTITCNPIPENEKDAWLETQQQLDAYEQQILDEKIRDSVLEKPILADTLPEAESLAFIFEKPDDSFVLSNGLTVFIKKRETTPFITASCLFKQEETFDLYCRLNHQSNLQHLTMQLLPESCAAWNELGLPQQTKQEIRNFFHNLGASISFDAQGGSLSCLNNDLTTVAQHFVQILSRPEFPEKAFLLMRDNAIKRIELNQEDAEYLASRTLSHYLYNEYPWEITDQEIIDEFKQCTWQDLQRFHQNYVAPTNMFLVIVGNIDTTTIKEQLEESFGRWTTTSSTVHNIDNIAITVPEINNPTAHAMQTFLPQEQVILQCGRLTTYQDTNERMALRVLEYYLHRRIYEIRETTGVFYRCQSSLSKANHQTKGIASISCLVSVDRTEAAEEAIKAVLQEIAAYGISENDLKIAKQNYLAILAKGFSTNAALADSYATLVANNKDWGYFDKRLEKCNTLTLDFVNAVAQKYLHPAQWTFVKIGRLQ